MRERSRLLFAVGLATGVVLLSSVPASAALCARWETPAPAVVGRAVDVGFKTYVPEATSGGEHRLRLHAFPDYPFKVTAQSPAGDVERVSTAPSRADATLWLGEFTPNESGTWTLRIENLQGADLACYEDAVLPVEAGRPSTVKVVTLIAGVLILAGLVVGTLIRRRHALRAAETSAPS